MFTHMGVSITNSPLDEDPFDIVTDQLLSVISIYLNESPDKLVAKLTGLCAQAIHNRGFSADDQNEIIEKFSDIVRNGVKV